MYDIVPHTRALLVTGSAVGKDAEEGLEKAGIRPSDYQGPTIILSLLSQRAPELGMETSQEGDRGGQPLQLLRGE